MDAAALEAAFRAAIYRVETPAGCFDLRIGGAYPVFDDWLRGRGVERWGILTASNPGAVRLADDVNALRQAQLCERLADSGWYFFPACNLDATGVWPPESGCLILEVDPVRLCALAEAFSQRAVVCGEVGAPPRLLWI